jgi:hypothetical protein
MKCPICRSPGAGVTQSVSLLDGADVQCPSCGRYRLAGDERNDVEWLTDDERQTLSDILREEAAEGRSVTLLRGSTRQLLEARRPARAAGDQSSLARPS